MTNDAASRQPGPQDAVPPPEAPHEAPSESPPPPPGGYATERPALVRPLHGRYLAGVCAALGRATNTDPVLWRVLLAVLTLFGGVGLLAYLVCWMLIPGEGDTASPLESLIGRGDSNTSGLTVVLATLVAVLVFVFVLSDGFRVAVLGVAAVVAALLLVQRGNAGRAPHPPRGYPPAPGYPPPGYPPAPGYPPVPPAAASTAPFAPHGPFVSAPAPPMYTPPRPPVPRRPPSRLGRVVLSLLCLALGTLAVLDLFVGELHASAYFAVALAVVGFGLLAGAWLGRARWLIFIGLALSVALGASSVAETGVVDHYRGQPITWRPATIADLQSTYQADFADATLDLRHLDFATAENPITITANVDAGGLRVLLPANVDVDATVDVDTGSAMVFGEKWGGIDNPTREIQDTGRDGPGGGRLILEMRIDLGQVEVVR